MHSFLQHGVTKGRGGGGPFVAWHLWRKLFYVFEGGWMCSLLGWIKHACRVPPPPPKIVTLPGAASVLGFK
jgi:hypothetical protein